MLVLITDISKLRMCQVKSRIEKWTDRVQRDGLVEFAIGYLQEHKVELPVNARRRSVADMTPRAKLAEMVADVMRLKDGEFRFRLLQDAVRQKRAALVREKEKRSIKRLDLSDSACAKLESLSRATRLRQSTLVENLITDEDAIRKRESIALKHQRQIIRERSDDLKVKGDELESREKRLLREEESFAERLSKLETYEKLVNALLACDANDLSGVMNVSEKGIEYVYSFTASRDLTSEIREVKNAWRDVYEQHRSSTRDV